MAMFGKKVFFKHWLLPVGCYALIPPQTTRVLL